MTTLPKVNSAVIRRWMLVLVFIGILLVVLVHLWNQTSTLGSAMNSLQAQVEAVLERDTLSSPTDVALELRLLEGKAIYLQEQADQAYTSINTILTWTQALGIAVAVIAGIVTLVGFADNREEKQRLDADHALLAKELSKVQRLYDDVTVLKDELETLPQRSAQAIQALSLAQVAQQQIQLKNLNEAILRLEVAHKLDPQNAVILYFLGDVCVRSGRRQEGLAYLKQVVDSDDPFPSARASYAYALRLIGDDFYESGDLEKGKENYQEAEKLYLHLNIDHPELLDIFGESVYGALAGLYRRWGDVDNALKYYRQSLKTTPLSSYLLNNIATLEFCRDRTVGEAAFRDAMTYANEKLRIDNTDYWSLFDRITAQIALGEASDVMRRDLTTAFTMTVRDPSALKKFYSGLKELLCADPLPPGLLPTIAAVENEIKRRSS